jgi:hypothetical protein
VYNVKSDYSAPFFHISQGTADTSTVQIIKDGHFAYSFIDDGATTATPLPFVVDPSVVFNVDTTTVHPSGFFDKSTSFAEFMSQTQGTTSRTPCAFAGAEFVVGAKSSVSITTIYGHASSVEEFVNIIVPKLRTSGYAAKKRTAANALVSDITSKVSTTTSSVLLDAYIKQDFLDNVLRGGLPVAIGLLFKLCRYYFI